MGLWRTKCDIIWIVLNICDRAIIYGGAHGVMVIVIGNGHDDTSSNPGQDWLHFT